MADDPYVYKIHLSDGSVVSVAGDAGMSDQQIQDFVAARLKEARPEQKFAPAKVAREKPTSFTEGVAQGVSDVGYNLARVARYGADKLGIDANAIDAIGEAINPGSGLPTGGVDQAQAQFTQGLNAGETTPSGGGRLVGNMLATAPTAMLPGGILAQGAVGGAMLTSARDPAGVAMDAGLGALTGGVTHGLMKGAGAVAEPFPVSQHLRTLLDAGIKPTPGQVARSTGSRVGQFLGAREDRATSLPFVGDMIASDRTAANLDYVKGAVNRSLKPLGQELPPTITNGNEAMSYARRSFSRAYDSALSKMHMVPDEQYVDDAFAVTQKLTDGSLDEPSAQRLKSTVQNVVVRRLNENGNSLDGDTLKTVLSQLRQRAKGPMSSADASQREYGQALMDVHDAVKGAATRASDPDAVAALQRADEGYAHYVLARSAAKNATEGNFTPGQYETSVRQGDRSVGKGRTAEGEALGQDYAIAGRTILPSKTGDSGTASRSMNMNPLAWAVGAGSAPLYGIGKAYAAGATREAGPISQGIGDLIRLGTKPATLLGIAAPANITRP